MKEKFPKYRMVLRRRIPVSSSPSVPFPKYSKLVYVCQNQEVNLDSLPLTKLQTLFRFYHLFYNVPFLFQDPVEDTTLHLVIMFRLVSWFVAISVFCFSMTLTVLRNKFL